MNRITQLITFPQVSFFHDRLCKRYSLHAYESKTKPSICFGCYPGSTDWIKKITNHKSLLVLVWAGSDSMYILKDKYSSVLKTIKSADHVRHIAISQYISQDLTKAGIDHKFIPITQVIDNMFEPARLGGKVFYYDSHSSKKSVFYGTPIIKRVMKYFQLQTLSGYSGGNGHTKYTEMPRVYEQCFIGLRLTPHDGLPNTVVEMGLMGRKCVCNHELPNCVPWKSEDDIIDTIRSEMQKIGTMDEVEDVSRKMREYISIPSDWLYEEYW